MTDSCRWCEVCGQYGDHHTDRHPLPANPEGVEAHRIRRMQRFFVAYGIPEPAPEIVMDASGVYWRSYPDGLSPEVGLTEPMLSMVPVSENNDPTPFPRAVYRLVAWESEEGVRHRV